METKLKTCPVMLAEVGPHYGACMRHIVRTRGAVDGGAHKGHWTFRMLSDFQDVWAFEPVTENYQAMLERCRYHASYREKLNAMRCGLSDKTGRAAMLPGAVNDGQWHVCQEDTEARAEVIPHEVVDMIALDDLRLKKVDFIKLDVEGFELYALQGAMETIKASKPVICLEENASCLRYGVRPYRADKLLKSMGYRLVERLNKDYIYKHGDAP